MLAGPQKYDVSSRSGAILAPRKFSRIFNAFLCVANESSANVTTLVNVSVFPIIVC